MSHTPGPWVLNGWDVVRAGCDNSFPTLAAVTGGGALCLEEINANARLIAAAPELLDRLRECVTWLEEYYDAVSLDEDQEQHLQAARAAIAKAEGRSE